MNQVEQAVLAKVISVLNSIDLKYAIVDSDGNKHGDLNIEQPKKPKRRRSIYPLGEVRNHIMPHMQGLLINSTKHIPVGTYAPEVIRSSVSSYATHMWGSGNYKTKITEDKQFVELTRFDPLVADFMRKDPLTALLDGFEKLPTREIRASS